MKIRNCLSYLCLSLAIFMVMWAGYLFWQSESRKDKFKFHHINIQMHGKHENPTELADIVAQHLKGGFFSFNTKELQTRLQARAWIKKVSFRRIWPDTLAVNVFEKNPIARFGKHQLVTARGEIFSPLKLKNADDLPLLLGASASVGQMLETYSRFQAILSTIGVKVTQISLSPRQAWRLSLDHKILLVLGKDDVEKRLQRFLILYPSIIRQYKGKTLSIDLRYPNGAAVAN
jgi:cell division protein FtsQ